MDNFVIERQVEVPYSPIITIAKYSPSGNCFALLTTDKYVNIVDASNLLLIRSVDFTKYSEVRDIEFSPYCEIIGTAADNALVLFGTSIEANFCIIIRSLTFESENYFSLLAFGFPTVLIATSYHYIHVFYNYQNGIHPCAKFFPYDSIITSISVLSDSAVINSYMDGACVKWNYTDDPMAHLCETFPRDPIFPITKITHTAVSVDNMYLLLTHACSKLSSYKYEKNVLSKNSRTITFLRVYEGHIGLEEDEFEIKGTFLFYGEEKFVIAGSELCYIHIWNFETADCVRILDCNGAIPTSIIYNQTENLERFAALQNNGKLFIWRRCRQISN